jgi:RimJ/RimL family protein N-acetyltransferase
MADVLQPVAFSAELLPYVAGFDCGPDPWEKEPADWIQRHALKAMDLGTKVWLYMNQDGLVVGFSSLDVGRSKLRYPTPDSPRVGVLVIPELGLRKDFKGEPKAERLSDPTSDGRYSSQIMRHLLDAASQWPGDMQAVTLYVDPRNIAAVRLYERFGFEKYGKPHHDDETGVSYDRYAIRRSRLVAPPASRVAEGSP